MRFLPTEEQQAFAEAIDEIVEGHGGTEIPRSWAAGDTGPGLALWAQFAELGLTGLRLPEEDGGLGGSVADLVVVFERLGYHAVPGPYLESIALLPRLLDADAHDGLAGGAIATASVAGVAPAALDADVAGLGYEEARDELSAIVARLESGQVGLEESMRLWARGEALAARCTVWLDRAQASLDGTPEPAGE